MNLFYEKQKQKLAQPPNQSSRVKLVKHHLPRSRIVYNQASLSGNWKEGW